MQRVEQRGLRLEEIEKVITDRHAFREQNLGEADWRLCGVRPDGRRFVVIYDFPVFGDAAAIRVVSVWVLRDRMQT
jgi:uncharacterized DUF497 family protein